MWGRRCCTGGDTVLRVPCPGVERSVESKMMNPQDGEQDSCRDNEVLQHRLHHFSFGVRYRNQIAVMNPVPLWEKEGHLTVIQACEEPRIRRMREIPKTLRVFEH